MIQLKYSPFILSSTLIFLLIIFWDASIALSNRLNKIILIINPSILLKSPIMQLDTSIPFSLQIDNLEFNVASSIELPEQIYS